MISYHDYSMTLISPAAKAINISSPDDPTAEGSEEFLELPNGCLCCSIKDTGVAAIEKLMQRKGAFDHILLETTGLADPGPIASIFWKNEEYTAGLGNDISLDGVICVVDAVFGQKQMQDDSAIEGEGESLRQVACADVILLNKVDLVTADKLASTEELIGKVNPAAPIYKTTQGQVDLSLIMGIEAFASPSSFRRAITVPSHVHDDAEDAEHHHDTHYEARGISSLQVTCPVLSPGHLERLDEWIRTVLWENRLPEMASGAEGIVLKVLRCKGLFTTVAGDKYVLQGVQDLYEISKIDEGEAVGVPAVGKLVLIGKGLNSVVRHSLQDVFN